MSESDVCLTFTKDGPLLDVPGCAPVLGTAAVDGRSLEGPWEQANGSWVQRLQHLTVEIEPVNHHALRAGITNTGDTALRLNQLTFPRFAPEAFSPRLDTEPFSELVHGGSFLGMGCGVKRVGRQEGRLDHLAPSDMVRAFQHDDGYAWLIGILPPLGGAFCRLHDLHSEPHLEGEFGFEARHEFACMLQPGQTVHTSAMVALNGQCANDLLARYGELWAQTGQGRPRKSVRVGWNSWDYAAGAVTEPCVKENVETGRTLFGDALQTFCIDEGWETQWGSWEPNRKFPGGLKGFIETCRAQNVVPGIWTAPLLVNTYNPLFYEKPEWFASRADGQLQSDTFAYGPMAYLDVTRNEVQEHIRALFSRLRELGFQYFKVDFSHCILKAERFDDPSVPRAHLIRSAFQTIREAIGEDAYLLGCGAPYESVFGLVDAVRTTGDIHTYWGHVLMNAGGVACRWWMQNTLWNTDPDFLVVRGDDTATPPHFKRRIVAPMPPGGAWMAGREFNEDEAKAYALLIHLSGGDVILGDHLPLLQEKGIDIIRKVLEPRTPARPVDLFHSDQCLPRLWISKGEQDTLVAYFNWADKPAAVTLDLESLGLTGTPADLWSATAVETLPRTMRRRSALALVFR